MGKPRLYTYESLADKTGIKYYGLTPIVLYLDFVKISIWIKI